MYLNANTGNRKFLFLAVILSGIGLVVGILCSSAFSDKASPAPNDQVEMLQLYENSEFAQASHLASRNLNQPLSRLIFHLCQAYDLRKQDIDSALKGLKSIADDNEIPRQERLEAQLSYIRIIQLTQLRGYTSKYDSIDVVPLYRSFIAMAQNDIRACYAAMYAAENGLEAYFKNPSGLGYNQSIQWLEDFIGHYQGDPQNLVCLHLYIEQLYSNFAQDYSKSAEHLEKADRLGVASQITRRNVLYKLGRLNDIKLGNHAKACTYYREFLKLYPNELRTPLVKSYLASDSNNATGKQADE